LTVKHPPHVACPASGLVTVTLRTPVVAPLAIVMFAVNDVEVLNVVELTVMPVPENVALAPLTNPVPTSPMFCETEPWPRLVGDVDVNVGPVLTVKQFGHVAAWVSAFVIVTSRKPVAAPDAIVMFAVAVVVETYVVELTVIPAPEKETVALCAKLVPVTVMSEFVVP